MALARGKPQKVDPERSQSTLVAVPHRNLLNSEDSKGALAHGKRP
jgi:hypothetical protein